MSTRSATIEAIAGTMGNLSVVFCERDTSGKIWVNVPGMGRVQARSLTGIKLPKARDSRFQAVVMNEDGDPARPILMGVVALSPEESIEVVADGKTMILTAENEVSLRCGKASITLTKAGKVLITGEYVVSRARGTQRIKGGSVQIN